jgi:iron-sulfur cluster repair protein YtfE (RIC family)
MAYKLTKKSNLGQVAEECPRAIELLTEYGLFCAGCFMRVYETVETGAKIHGLSDKDIHKMISEINDRLA